MKILQKIFFRLRERASTIVVQLFRRCYWRIQGMKIGNSASLQKIFVTWPHQVSPGEHCNLEHDIFFKYDGIWQQGPSILIGARSFIGAYFEFNIRKKSLLEQTV